ncbi:hypothetical protein NN561_007614 [Cricetulus griseus]
MPNSISPEACPQLGSDFSFLNPCARAREEPGRRGPATGTPRRACHSCPARRTCRPPPTLRPRRATLPERWSLAVAPRGGVRASCGRAASGLRGGARISHAKLIPPRHAGRPPARGCAVLGRAAVSSPLRPLCRGVPCCAGHRASSAPLTCQLSSLTEGRGAARVPGHCQPHCCDLLRWQGAGPQAPPSGGPGAQSYSGLGRQLHACRRTADSSSPLILQPV